MCKQRHPRGIYLQNTNSLCTSISKKQPNMGTRFKWTFPHRRHRDGQLVREKMLKITNHQENALQNHKRNCLMPTRMVILKKTLKTSVGKGGLFGRTVNQSNYYENLYEGSSENQNYHMSQQFHFQYLFEENKATNSERYMHPQFQCSSQIRKQSVLSVHELI